jgi:hypothetical protein
MAISKEALAKGLETIRNQFSDNAEIDIKEARKLIAEQEAQLIHDFVIGRQTNVTGSSVSGGPVTGTGIIQ